MRRIAPELRRIAQNCAELRRIARLVLDHLPLLLAADDAADRARRRHLLLLLGGDRERLELRHLLVEAGAEALLDVVDRRELHEVLEVVETLLRHVREAERVVAPHRPRVALLRLEVADQQLEEGRLARAVAADDHGARAEGERGVRLLEDPLLRLGVLERDVLQRGWEERGEGAVVEG